MEDNSCDELVQKGIIEEIKKMITFENPNNFDEYFTKMLPKSDSILKNINEETEQRKMNLARKRKNPNPIRRDWTDGISTDMIEFNPYRNIEIPDLNENEKLKLKAQNNLITKNSLNKISKNLSLKSKINSDPISMKGYNEDQASKTKTNPSLCAKKTANTNDQNKFNFTGGSVIDNMIREINYNTNSNNMIIDEENEYFDYNLNLRDNENYDFVDNSGLECLICKWRYPKQMNADEINAHVNFCIEGNGEQHQIDYMKSLNITDERDNSNSSLKKNCPICEKPFTMKSEKHIKRHVFDCLREKQEKEFYENKKRKHNKINPSL